MEIKNAVIEDVDIGTCQYIGDEEPVIVAKITFTMGELPDVGVTVRLPDDCVGEWLQKFFGVAGTNGLWQGIGKAVRLKIDETFKEHVKIGHIIKDVWFNPYDLREDSAA